MNVIFGMIFCLLCAYGLICIIYEAWRAAQQKTFEQIETYLVCMADEESGEAAARKAIACSNCTGVEPYIVMDLHRKKEILGVRVIDKRQLRGILFKDE